MAVPVRKKSKAKKRSRRANHDRMTMPHVVVCEKCGADMLSHHACASCGWYAGRVAVVVEEEDDLIEEGDEG